MADVENQQESSFPVKRKSDLYCQDQDTVANKAQKLIPSSNSADSESKDGESNGNGVENLNFSTEVKIGTESSSISPEKTAGSDLEKDENGVAGDLGAEEEQEDGDEEEGEDEEEEEEEEDYSIEPETDRKGQGISREDKGKGKLIEVDESDDEDDEGVDEDDESDFSDDPLAEVDLDNILPSRTRRRSIQPGVYISNEVSNRGGNNEDDDDSSDDSDA